MENVVELVLVALRIVPYTEVPVVLVASAAASQPLTSIWTPMESQLASAREARETLEITGV